MYGGDSLATSARGDERVQVETWRLRVLLEAGYPLAVAESIAASTADLHQAVEMLEQGCEPELVADILL